MTRAMRKAVRMAASIDQGLLRLLRCPVSGMPLVVSGAWLYANDRAGRLKYPLRDGLPELLSDSAQVATLDEFDRVMAQVSSPQ